MSELNDQEIFFPEAKKVTIGKEVFEISEFTFENRIVFLKFVSEVFKELYEKNPDIVNSGNLKVVIKLIEVAGEKLIDIYKIVLKKEEQWIRKNLTLKKECEIIVAILEVNDIPFLLSQVQKMLPSNART